MKNIVLHKIVLIGIFLLVLVSCKNDNLSSSEQVNRFIVNGFEDVYLWNSSLPKINVRNESDPYALFNKLKYEQDKWSLLTDDVKSLLNSFAGEETNFGYSLAFYYRYENSDEVIAVVKFVYKDSPAERAGLKRGDIILKINGQTITEKNYRDLYYSRSIKAGISKYEEENISPPYKEVSLTAISGYMNPVHYYTIIRKGNDRIGYLHYTDYLLKSHNELQEVFSYFKTNGVTDVVLDLRYNGGGTAVTSQLLCSLLVPEEVLGNRDIYLQQNWNKRYNDYFKKEGKERNKMRYDFSYTYKDQNDEYKTDRVKVNMNLSRIFILTGKNTASASEATVVGLKPYMEVITIGEATVGKYWGGAILQPTDYDMNDSEIQNWGMYVMIYHYTNKNGFPDHTNGFLPMYQVKENILSDVPLGDESEQVLSKAIELITGVSGSIKKSIPVIEEKYKRAVGLEEFGNNSGKMLDLDLEFVSF